MLREHAEVLESTRKAIRQEIGEAMGQVARSTVETNRSIWTAALVSGVTSGVVAGLAVFLLL